MSVIYYNRYYVEGRVVYMKFKEILKKLRTSMGMTQEELAHKLDIPESTIRRYESSDEGLPNKKRLEGIADLFKVSVDYLLGRPEGESDVLMKELNALADLYGFDSSDRDFLKIVKESLELSHIELESIKKRSDETIQNYIHKMREEEMQNTPDMTSGNLISIPVIGEIKAGYDLLAEQNIIGYEITSRNDLKEGETYFYLLVKGDSMINAGIHDGYRVLVRKQNFIEEGKIGVVIVNGDEATLKRVYYDNDMIRLVAENPKIPSKTYPIDEALIQGQVIKFEGDV
jgi:SOS-response transcriptional repressor LexA